MCQIDSQYMLTSNFSVNVVVVLKMASQGATPDSFILESFVRGHHIYKQTWTPFLGERIKAT